MAQLLMARPGPLAEISYWRSRSEDLSRISTQLSSENVTRITAVLETAASAYLSPFLSLRDIIMAQATLAAENRRVLSCLEEPCNRMQVCPQKVGTDSAAAELGQATSAI